MPQFIRLTSRSLGVVRINVDHLVTYHLRHLVTYHLRYTQDETDHPTYVTVSTTIPAAAAGGYYVKETPEEIDRLINPGYTA